MILFSLNYKQRLTEYKRRNTNDGMRTTDDGFTLFELVLVLVLIGILSFTTVPLLTNTHIVSLDGASHKLESDLQYAQALATTTGESYGMRTTESDDSSTYEIYRVSDDSVVTSPYDNGPMQEDFTDEFGEVSFSSDCTVTFDDEGLPTFVTGSSPIVIENSDGEIKTISINSSGLIRRE